MITFGTAQPDPFSQFQTHQSVPPFVCPPGFSCVPDTTNFQHRQQKPERPHHYSVVKRLEIGTKYALNGKALRKSFFKGVFWTIITLPTALLIPGPQLAIIPARMALGIVSRFLKGLTSPKQAAQKLDRLKQ